MRQRRVGLVHAGANATGIVLMLASFRRRRRNPAARDVVATGLSMAALGAVGAGGALGGHLVFGQGAGLAMTPANDGPAFDPVLADVDTRNETESADGHFAHAGLHRKEHR